MRAPDATELSFALTLENDGVTRIGEGRVLVVEDNALDRALLEQYLTRGGYELAFAQDGMDGWTLLESAPDRFDVVLLDRELPRMMGLELLDRIKQDPRLRTIPVIIQTAYAMRAEMLEGIRAGAYYYLTKPYDVEVLLTVVSTAVKDYEHYRELQEHVARGAQCMSLLQNATFEVRTIAEARDLASMLANVCPEPMTAVIGLTELLVNAVEHGNLGISYEEKTSLNASGGWDLEVQRRLALPENASKRVLLGIERDREELRFTIRDQGPGFDWRRYLEVDPQRAFDNHGRGIAIARTLSFQGVEYRGSGNEVIARVNLGENRSARPRLMAR